MARIIDNLIALRIIYLLTVPIEKTDAYKLGLIDVSGSTIKKAETSEEKNATQMLHRLVWNIKKVFALVPGGKTRIGSLAAAYLLVRESYEQNHDEVQGMKHFVENFDRVWGLPFNERELVEDALSVLDEEGIANVTAGASVNQPTVKGKIGRRFAEFQVDNNTFNKFNSGKAKMRKWANYLNLEDTTHKMIYDFAKKNPSGVIVLKDQNGNKKGIHYQKKGNDNWTNLRKKIDESSIEFYEEFVVEDL